MFGSSGTLGDIFCMAPDVTRDGGHRWKERRVGEESRGMRCRLVELRAGRMSRREEEGRLYKWGGTPCLAAAAAAAMVCRGVYMRRR
jgi:hypothetical protein